MGILGEAISTTASTRAPMARSVLYVENDDDTALVLPTNDQRRYPERDSAFLGELGLLLQGPPWCSTFLQMSWTFPCFVSDES